MCTHCFWAIDDLIFNTLNKHALKRIWPTAEYLCEKEEVTIFVKHYKEPTCHMSYREGHKLYPRTAQMNFEPGLDDPHVEIKEKQYRKRRGKRKQTPKYHRDKSNNN